MTSDRTTRQRAIARMQQAFELGPMAQFCLRAEDLLDLADAGEIQITEEEHARLDHVAVVPSEGDLEFLGSFDDRLEESEAGS